MDGVPVGPHGRARMGGAVSPRAWIEVGLVAVAGIVGGLGVHEWRASLEATGRAEVYHARADSLHSVAAELQRRQEALDVQAHAAVEEEHRARVAAEAKADSLARIRPHAAEHVVRVAVDSGADSVAVQRAVDSLEALHAGEVASLRAALYSADSIITVQARQLAVRDQRITALEEQVATLGAEAQAWKAARPGFFSSIGGKATTLLIGAGIGLVVDRTILGGR